MPACLAAVEWQIALTSRLLLSPRRASHLSTRRPVLERRLRRILGYLRSPGAFLAIAAWRRAAQEGHRTLQAAALGRLSSAVHERAAAADNAEMGRRHHAQRHLRAAFSSWRTLPTGAERREPRPLPTPPPDVRCLCTIAAFASWRAAAGRAAITLILTTRANESRLRVAFRILAATCWRRWFVAKAAERIVARRRLLAAAPVMRALARAASRSRTIHLCAALGAAHAHGGRVRRGWSTWATWMDACRLSAPRHHTVSVHAAAHVRGALRAAFLGWARQARLDMLPAQWFADGAARAALVTWRRWQLANPSHLLRTCMPRPLVGRADGRPHGGGSESTLLAPATLIALQRAWRQLRLRADRLVARSSLHDAVAHFTRARALLRGVASWRAAGARARARAAAAATSLARSRACVLRDLIYDRTLRAALPAVAALAARAALAVRAWRRRGQWIAAMRRAHAPGRHCSVALHLAHRVRYRGLVICVGMWRRAAASRRSGRVAASLGASCAARRRLARALWDWRGVVHRRSAWRMTRELTKLRRQSGIAAAAHGRPSPGIWLAVRSSGDDGERGDGGGVEVGTPAPMVLPSLGSEQARRASALAHRCRRRDHLRLLVRAWHATAHMCALERAGERAAALRAATRAWRRHAVGVRKVRAARVLGRRLAWRAAMMTWSHAATGAGVRAEIARRRRCAVELHAWRRQLTRRARGRLAREHADRASVSHMLRVAMRWIREAAATRMQHASQEHLAVHSWMHAALVRFQIAAGTTAAAAGVVAALTTRASAAWRERCARASLGALWRWKAYAVAVGALTPITGTELRSRRRRRELAAAVRTWACASTGRAAQEERGVQATHHRMRTVLARLHRISTAASAAAAIRKVERLVRLRRGATTAFSRLCARAARRAALAHAEAAVSARWGRYARRDALGELLRYTVTRLLHRRVHTSPAHRHWAGAATRRAMVAFASAATRRRVQTSARDGGQTKRLVACLARWSSAVRMETRANARHVSAVHGWQRLGLARAMRALIRARARRCGSVWRSRTRLQQAAAKAAAVLSAADASVAAEAAMPLPLPMPLPMPMPLPLMATASDSGEASEECEEEEEVYALLALEMAARVGSFGGQAAADEATGAEEEEEVVVKHAEGASEGEHESDNEEDGDYSDGGGHAAAEGRWRPPDVWASTDASLAASTSSGRIGTSIGTSIGQVETSIGRMETSIGRMDMEASPATPGALPTAVLRPQWAERVVAAAATRHDQVRAAGAGACDPCAVVYTSIDEPSVPPPPPPPEARTPLTTVASRIEAREGSDVEDSGPGALDAQFATFRASSAADGGGGMASAAQGSSATTAHEVEDDVLSTARLDEQFEVWAKSSANTPPTSNLQLAAHAHAPPPVLMTRAAAPPSLLMNVITSPLPPRPTVRRALVYHPATGTGDVGEGQPW